MIKYYSFKEVDKSKLNGKGLIIKKHQFLYSSLNKKIKYYIDNKTEKEYINYFDRVFFEIIKTDYKPDAKKYDFFACHIYKKDNDDKDIDITDSDISKELRNSKTLTIDDSNSYNTDHLKIVYAERGFAFIAKKFKEQADMFEKNYILYLLAHAYNLYSEKLMKEISDYYEKGNDDEILKVRKEIYIFDLNCFFVNPVYNKNHQIHNLWTYLEKIYKVEQNHNQMKYQVKDLVNLIEMDLKDNENKRASRRTAILGIIGLMITTLSIGSVYADLVGLGVPNIFKTEIIKADK